MLDFPKKSVPDEILSSVLYMIVIVGVCVDFFVPSLIRIICRRGESGGGKGNTADFKQSLVPI